MFKQTIYKKKYYLFQCGSYGENRVSTTHHNLKVTD